MSIPADKKPFPTMNPQSARRRAEHADPERIFTWLRDKKAVSDLVFDSIFPQDYQDLSTVHWTPIRVIRRAVELATESPDARILDVGSGVGKFCLIGALLSEGHFVGVEQRKHLADLATSIAVQYGISNASFLNGDAFDLDWNDFDVVYLFNPFSEHVDSWLKIDDTVSLSQERFDDYVRRAEEKFSTLNAGKRVLVYNGFGGEMPPGLSRLTSDVFIKAKLELWEKA